MHTESLGFYLLHFSCLNRSVLKLLSRKINLSVTEFRILMTFIPQDVQTVSSISQCLSIQKGRISPLVQELVEHKVLRRKPSKEDRRVAFLYLTKKGGRMLEQIFSDFENLFKPALDDITSEDITKLRHMFERIIESLTDVSRNLSLTD